MNRYLAALVLPLILGCPSPTTPEPMDQTVVELIPADKEGETTQIKMSELRLALARLRLEREGSLAANPLPVSLKDVVIDRMIEQRLLLAEAELLGVRASTTAVARELNAIRLGYPPGQFDKELIKTYQTKEEFEHTIRDRLTTALLLERAASNTSITENELQKAWAAKPGEEKRRKARVHARQIVLQTEKDGLEVLQALKKKEDFAVLAKTRSVAPEAERGGDLGWFEAGVMPDVFDRVCFTLAPGDISPLTTSHDGFHVFQVIEKEEERELTFEEARPRLHAEMMEKQIEEAHRSYLARLKSRTKIIKNDALIASIE